MKDEIARLEFEVGLQHQRRLEAEAELRAVQARADEEVAAYRKEAVDSLYRINSFIQASYGSETATEDRGYKMITNRILVVLWDVMRDIDPDQWALIMKDEDGSLLNKSEAMYTQEDIQKLKSRIFEGIMADRKRFTLKQQEVFSKQLLVPLVLNAEV